MSDNQNPPHRTTLTRFYTVVYRVVGGNERHDEWWRQVQPLFLSDDPISITTIATWRDLTKWPETTVRTCQTCGGKGHVMVGASVFGGPFLWVAMLFERNDPDGLTRDRCERCKGRGYVRFPAERETA